MTYGRRIRRGSATLGVVLALAGGLLLGPTTGAEATTRSGVDVDVWACMSGGSYRASVVHLPTNSRFVASTKNSTLWAQMTNFVWRNGRWVGTGTTQWFWASVAKDGHLVSPYPGGRWKEYETGRDNEAPHVRAEIGSNKVAIRLVQVEWSTNRTLRDTYEWVDHASSFDCDF